MVVSPRQSGSESSGLCTPTLRARAPEQGGEGLCPLAGWHTAGSLASVDPATSCKACFTPWQASDGPVLPSHC